MAAYPGTLPQFMLYPVNRGRNNARLVTSFDAGAPKVRRRFTNVPDFFNTRVGPFSQAQETAFWTWWIDDLKEGALSFTWKDPLGLTSLEVMFDPERQQEPPEFVDRQPVEGVIKSFTTYNLLEVLV